MKKICLFLILGLLGQNICSSQIVKVYFGDLVTYTVPQPTYLFQKDCPLSNVITITEETFLKYIDSICTNSTSCDTNIVSEVTPGMIQIVYVKSPKKYYTINMPHSLTGTTIKNGFLEIDGEVKNFILSFQEIMDEIINYHVQFPNSNINSKQFLSEIIRGKRRKLVGYQLKY